ncbi:MAG TPA: cytochrome P450, partial [Acidimicrobiales bacterium]|nr:cytochrome P450 [Acidimicrobiales bacterium]
DDVAAITYDTEHFSSVGVIVSNMSPLVPAPVGVAPPITSDPPFHGPARRLLLPAFAPKPISALEPFARDECIRLLAALEGADTADAARDYAQHIPTVVIARMLGLPPDDADLFRAVVHDLLEAVDVAPEVRQATTSRWWAYLDERIEEHRSHPQDDLISFLLDVELEGEKLSHEHVRGTIHLLLIAGIDTTWSAIGASLWHLATHADDRRRLVEDPSLIPTACEEFLRAYAPVTMARKVAEDVEVGGCSMKAGEWVLLPFPVANRDPEKFPEADTVVIDRLENRHAAFGLGIHRCLGSNLARMELRVALEEWLTRIPSFELIDGATVTWSAGQVRGPRSVPVRILPSTAA